MLTEAKQCSKPIYKFCLFHALLGDIAMCFSTLLYLFTHIWTNLLTKCTQCQFLSADVCKLQVFTHIYRTPKIPRKSDKKSAYRNLLESLKEGQRGATPLQADRGRGPTPVRARRA